MVEDCHNLHMSCYKNLLLTHTRLLRNLKLLAYDLHMTQTCHVTDKLTKVTPIEYILPLEDEKQYDNNKNKKVVPKTASDFDSQIKNMVPRAAAIAVTTGSK